MLLGFGLEQRPHEAEGRLPVSLSFSLCSVKAHSLILGNCVGFLFVLLCFCCWAFCVVCGFFLRCCFTLDTIEAQTKDLLIKS